jgi:hypothetical protein
VRHAFRSTFARQLVCIAVPFVAGFTLLTPHALASTLTVSFPTTSSLRQQATVTISGETDASDCDPNDGCGIDVYLVPPGGYCSSNEDDVGGEKNSSEIISDYSPQLDGSPDFGNYSDSALPTPFTEPGVYSVCGFLYSDSYLGWGSSNDLSYTAGTIDVPAPPLAACLVPKFAGLTEREMIHRLLEAHCAGGEIIRIRSRLRDGQVVHLGAKPGATLARGSLVRIYISKGEPRRRHRR